MVAVLEPLAPRKTIWQRLKSRMGRRIIAFYAFIAPWLLGLILLDIVPFVVGLYVSFTNFDGLDWPGTWVGFGNYVRAFTDDPDVAFSFGKTVLWSGLNTPLWVIISFTMALILNQAVKGRDFFRTLYYLPSVVPAVAAAAIWRVYLDANNGLLNAILSAIRPGWMVRWLSNYALPSITAISVWGGLGGGMVIFLAGLQNIPTELEEAALIDGATRLRVFRHITIPLMTPVIFFQLIMALIGSLQAFAMPMLVFAGGAMGGSVPRSVYLFVVHTYRQIFAFHRYGYGTALLWLISIVIIALTAVVFRTARYWVFYETALGGGPK